MVNVLGYVGGQTVAFTDLQSLLGQLGFIDHRVLLLGQLVMYTDNGGRVDGLLVAGDDGRRWVLYYDRSTKTIVGNACETSP